MHEAGYNKFIGTSSIHWALIIVKEQRPRDVFLINFGIIVSSTGDFIEDFKTWLLEEIPA